MHQYIKILTVCLCVCDERPLYFNLLTEPCELSAKNVRTGIQLGVQADACNRGAAVEAGAIGRAAFEADTIGEQQPKRTRSGAAAEEDASCEHAAAAEAGAIGEQ